jgi:hypothetical protein
MTRSYAFIFAAVTLRIYLKPREAVFGEETGYGIVAWACWVPNILSVGWLIRTRLRSHPEAPIVPADPGPKRQVTGEGPSSQSSKIDVPAMRCPAGASRSAHAIRGSRPLGVGRCCG